MAESERPGLMGFVSGKLAERAERKREEEQQAAEQAEQDRIARNKALVEEFERKQVEARQKDSGVRAIYANRMSTVKLRIPFVEDKIGELSSSGKFVEYHFKGRFELVRAISTMTRRECVCLEYMHLLETYGLMQTDTRWRLSAPIVYNEGRCEISKTEDTSFQTGYVEKKGLAGPSDITRHAMTLLAVGPPEVGIGRFLYEFAVLNRGVPDHPIIREFRELLLGGTNWLRDEDVPSSPFTFDRPAAGLFIGDTASGRLLWHEAEGALITVAPPGSGKTQCHVFPNLLTYRGPAVVLDVKGECFDQTAAWRRENVGPVFRFSPLDPDNSARFNPLALISANPETLWEDAKLVAGLLIVPVSLHDSSWELRAADIVAGVIAWLVRLVPPEQRTMAKILDVVSRVTWELFLESAAEMHELPALVRLVTSLTKLPEKQLEGVLDAARRHLSIWDGARIERTTAACDWTPDTLRDGSNPTIYICIPPNEIETYAPLLRVVFAMHLRQLLSKLPPREQTPILFLLDELPRLGTMKPVEEALEVGRQYGIRLWMFIQSHGQLEQAYRNASGMIGACAMRIYMNPSAHDGTARRLSEELGFVESIIDGSRQPLVEPSALTGPEFADLQIAIARNTRPAKLHKVFAYQDEALRQRMGGGQA